VRLALTDGTDLKVWQRGYHAKMIQRPRFSAMKSSAKSPRWGASRRQMAPGPARNRRKFRAVPALLSLPAWPGKSLRRSSLHNGAYAEYMRIPGRIVMENMLEVPHSVDDGSAALVEASGLRAARHSRNGSAPWRYSGGPSVAAPLA